MPSVSDLTAFLDAFAPATLAEPWDNVGLLLGDASVEVRNVMTCLTLTPDVAQEAIDAQVGLIVTHHPILFRPIKRITTETAEGAMLLALAKAGIAVHSPHTAFDGTADGINDRICRRLGLENVCPIRPLAGSPADSEALDGRPIGAGRYGALTTTLDFTAFTDHVRTVFDLTILEAVPSSGMVSKVAVACGAAAEFLSDAIRADCEVLVTGEARFHAAIEARTRGVGLVLLGHYASERFAVEELANVISRQFSDVVAWPSRVERDPIERY
ncbi:MAG: Nif3-like dinuclear metal center hexameric protein [Planctomycetaceae bacterium]